MSIKLNAVKKTKVGRSSIGGKGVDIFFGGTDESEQKLETSPELKKIGSDEEISHHVVKKTSKQKDKTTSGNVSKSTYSEEQYERVTYYLPPELKKKIKVEATIRDIKVSEFVIELLERQFKQIDKN